jgi:hypothetical protein
MPPMIKAVSTCLDVLKAIFPSPSPTQQQQALGNHFIIFISSASVEVS